MIRCQRGITLIEVLITLAILAFAGTMIWNVYFQGVQYSQKESTKNSMQQDANIIITNLTKIHQTAQQYEIKSSECKIAVDYKTNDGLPKTRLFTEQGICFSTEDTGVVDPSANSIKNLEITVSDKKDPNNKLTVNTMLYRLK